MEKYIKRVGKKEKAAMMRKSDQRYPVAIEGIRSRAIGQALLSQVYKIWNYGENWQLKIRQMRAKLFGMNVLLTGSGKRRDWKNWLHEPRLDPKSGC